MKKLTRAQAEVIYILQGGHWLDGMSIDPLDVFPNRDNRDNGCRRTFSTMARAGIFTRAQGGWPTDANLFEPNLDVIWDAWNEWWKSEGYKDLYDIFPNGGA